MDSKNPLLNGINAFGIFLNDNLYVLRFSESLHHLFAA